PADCGAHCVQQVLTPYSGEADATVSASYTTSQDGQSGACPATRPFAPTLAVAASPTTGGVFTSVTTTIGRGDKEQQLGGFTLSLPPGLLAKLGTIAPCPDTDATTGACPASSQVGTVTAKTGTGSSPATLSGKIYLGNPAAAGDV